MCRPLASTITAGGLHKISSILIYSSNDLCRMLNVSSQDVEILILAASNVVIPDVATVRDWHMREIKLHHRGQLNTSMLEGLIYCVRSLVMGLSCDGLTACRWSTGSWSDRVVRS